MTNENPLRTPKPAAAAPTLETPQQFCDRVNATPMCRDNDWFYHIASYSRGGVVSTEVRKLEGSVAIDARRKAEKARPPPTALRNIVSTSRREEGRTLDDRTGP